MSELAARAAAERAARESYGRLVALLAYQWRDLAAAEDALGEAFAAALAAWPVQGVPASPEAWLMTVAKRRLLMQARHRQVVDNPAVTALFDGAESAAPEVPPVPDERLKLMFVCAHPALPEPVRAPLMLQAVLGLEARAMADAFLVSPAAMAQRLVRAKARIRDDRVRFEEPEARELPPRLAAVLEAIYGAYTIGMRHDAQAALLGPARVPAGLTEEALYLCRVVIALLPQQPEPLGLLALMLHSQARRGAQFDVAGRFVPLPQQDPSSWQRELMAAAEEALWRASQLRQPGPFQLEAAIQSAHGQRAYTGQTPWGAIATLYAALVQHHPSVGAQVGHAVAVAQAGDAAHGLALLQALPAASVASYQPYWVAQAHLLARVGQPLEADRARQRAIGLTEDPRIRAFLAAQPA